MIYNLLATLPREHVTLRQLFNIESGHHLTIGIDQQINMPPVPDKLCIVYWGDGNKSVVTYSMLVIDALPHHYAAPGAYEIKVVFQDRKTWDIDSFDGVELVLVDSVSGLTLLIDKVIQA